MNRTTTVAGCCWDVWRWMAMIPRWPARRWSDAYELAPQKAMVAVPYAQALMMTGDEAQADSLLQAAIAEEPGNIEARSVYAFMALQKEDFQTALAALAGDAAADGERDASLCDG